MKFLKVAFLCSTALSMSAHAAQAEGPWTGFWIGAGVGGQIATGDATALFGLGGSASVEGGLDGDVGTESFFGTIGAGYDFQVNESIVVGIFGDYSFADEDTGNLSGFGFVGGGGSGSGSFDIDASFSIGDSWFIGGRVGYLITPETLFYALVGYSEFDTSARLFAEGGVFPFGGGDGFGRSSSQEGGLTVGAGAETMVTENISGKLEYRYTNLSSFGVNNLDDFDSSSGVFPTDFGSNWDPDIHSIRGTIAFHF